MRLTPSISRLKGKENWGRFQAARNYNLLEKSNISIGIWGASGKRYALRLSFYDLVESGGHSIISMEEGGGKHDGASTKKIGCPLGEIRGIR